MSEFTTTINVFVNQYISLDNIRSRTDFEFKELMYRTCHSGTPFYNSMKHLVEGGLFYEKRKFYTLYGDNFVVTFCVTDYGYECIKAMAML
jgi:hypothetical protein